MIVGGMTGGLVLAHGLADHTQMLSFSGYAIYPIVVTVAGAMGGLAPDIDMADSTAGKFLRKVLHTSLMISAIFLIAMYFLQRTGIEILDRAIDMGAGIDKNIPLGLAVFCLFILLIIGKSKHRGFTHTTVALLIVAAPLLYILKTEAKFSGIDIVISAQLGFVLGWFSHMVIDTFNYPGTPWLWPVIDKHFHIMRVESGTSEESIFLAISTVVFILLYFMIIR